MGKTYRPLLVSALEIALSIIQACTDEMDAIRPSRHRLSLDDARIQDRIASYLHNHTAEAVARVMQFGHTHKSACGVLDDVKKRLCLIIMRRSLFADREAHQGRFPGLTYDDILQHPALTLGELRTCQLDLFTNDCLFAHAEGSRHVHFCK